MLLFSLFFFFLSQAQAQECILEKSMLDNRKSNITAKVAAQVVEFYKDASRLIDLADQKQQINSRMHKVRFFVASFFFPHYSVIRKTNDSCYVKLIEAVRKGSQNPLQCYEKLENLIFLSSPYHPRSPYSFLF